MPSGNSKFDAAANEAGCAFLTAAGSQAASVATYSLLTGQLVLGAGAAIATGLAVWAYASNCQWDPDGEPENPQVNCGTVWKRSTPSDMYVFLYRFSPPTLPQVNNVQEITASYPRDENIWVIEYISAGDGQKYEYTLNWQGTFGACADLRGNGVPEKDSPDNPVNVPDYEYTDPDDGCKIIVQMGGLAMGPGGDVAPVWIMKPGEEQRASGGVIGGCNFNQTIYYDSPGGGGGGGGPITIPMPPGGGGGGDKPPWFDPLVNALSGMAGRLGAEAILKLFETEYAPGTRTIRAACEFNADGDPEEFSITYPKENYQARVLTALDAIVDFQQQILLWKTPICGGSSDKPDLFLHWRSVTFESDDYTETGNRRLVKRLRYRGSSPGDVVQLANHWKDFEWDTGGVIVYHKGSPVGTPQVWAASVDEGKRVLRHAFGEAGVDPDQVGEWGTSSSDHPRYGVPRRVKLKTIDGCWMATARSGPNGWPEASVCSPSP